MMQTVYINDKSTHFACNIFKFIFLYENRCILISFWLKFVDLGAINIKPVVFDIILDDELGDKPLSEPMMAYFTDGVHVTLGLGARRTNQGIFLYLITQSKNIRFDCDLTMWSFYS